MKGKIVKGIAGFYYVKTVDGIYVAKARGQFKNSGITPMVGDDVEMQITHVKDRESGKTLEVGLPWVTSRKFCRKTVRYHRS